MDIQYNQIEAFLNSCSHITPITIKNSSGLNPKFEEIVYLYQINNNGFWAKCKNGKIYKLHPNKRIDIIKIGSLTVETFDQFKNWIKDDNVYQNFKKSELIKQAYRHSKRK